MKKIIFGLIAFGVVCFATTGVLIYSHNQKIAQGEKHDIIEKSGDVSTEIKSGETSGENKKDEETVSGDIKENNKEKTLDLNGTYNENDIIISENAEIFNSVEIQIPQISGLKNKDIETKVNNSIREKIYSSLKEYSDIEYMSFYTNANFSNVLSIICTCGLKDDWKEIYLNYELINGEELKLDDLLSKNTDIYTVVRKAFYRAAAGSAVRNEDIEEPKYDPTTNTWYIYRYEWNTSTESSEKKKVEFVIDEDEVAQNIANFINSSRKDFFFSSQGVYLKTYNYFVNFTDIADNIVIYDKYLTDESLYERDDIGLKNLFTCAFSCSNVVKYQDYKMLGDNLFYDVAIKESDTVIWNRINAAGVNEKMCELLKKKSYKKLEEYKELASKNPDKFYVVIIRPLVSMLDFENNAENTYFIKTQLDIKLAENQESKEANMKQIKEQYRYPNVSFYGSAGDYYYDYNNPAKIVFEPVEWYDLKTLEKIDIEKYYNENEEYREFLNNVIKAKLAETYPTINSELEVESIKYDMKEDKGYFECVVIVHFKENEYGVDNIKLYTTTYTEIMYSGPAGL